MRTGLSVHRYSIASRSSFANLDKWRHEVQYHVGGDVKVVLLGNQCDVLSDKRQAW